MKLRRVLGCAAFVVLLTDAESQAQQSSQKPEPVTVAAQTPLRVTLPIWVEPPPKRFGVFTLTQPDHRGEVVQVSVPIGDIAMRAARGIGQAQHRRAEQKARKEVEQVMKELRESR
jgi:hypothetical protein